MSDEDGSKQWIITGLLRGLLFSCVIIPLLLLIPLLPFLMVFERYASRKYTYAE